MTGFIGSLLRHDEIGMAFASVGPYRLRSTVRPAYRNVGEALQVAMITGGMDAVGNGQTISGKTLENLPAVRGRAGALDIALSVGNLHLAGDGDLALYLQGLPADPARLMALLDEVSAAVPDADWTRVTAELDAQHGLSDDLALRADALRARGISLALHHHGPDDSLGDRTHLLRPKIVRIDGDWFSRMSGSEAGSALLPALISAMQSAGIDTFVDGLTDHGLVARAIATGANYLAGDALHPRVPLGAEIHSANRDLDAGRAGKIVPIRRRR